MTTAYLLDKRKDTNDEIERELEIVHSEVKKDDDEYLDLNFYSVDGYLVNISIDKDDPVYQLLNGFDDMKKKIIDAISVPSVEEHCPFIKQVILDILGVTP